MIQKNVKKGPQPNITVEDVNRILAAGRLLLSALTYDEIAVLTEQKIKNEACTSSENSDCPT